MSYKLLNTICVITALVLCFSNAMAEDMNIDTKKNSLHKILFWPIEISGEASETDVFVMQNALIQFIEENGKREIVTPTSDVHCNETAENNKDKYHCTLEYAKLIGIDTLVGGMISKTAIGWVFSFWRIATNTGKVISSVQRDSKGTLEKVLPVISEIAHILFEEIEDDKPCENSILVPPNYKRGIEWVGFNIGFTNLMSTGSTSSNNSGGSLNSLKLSLIFFTLKLNRFYWNILELKPFLMISAIGGGSRLGYRHPLDANFSHEIRIGTALMIDYYMVLDFKHIGTFSAAPSVQYIRNGKFGSFGIGFDFLVAIRLGNQSTWSHESLYFSMSKVSLGFSVYFTASFGSPF